MTPSFRLACGDAVDWLRTLPPDSADLVVTDPPYESLEKHRARGTTTRLSHSKASSNDWFVVFPNDRFAELFVEIHRVMRRNAHFYLFCDAETMFVAKPLAEAAGLRFWKPLVWDKCLGPETPIWTARGVLPAGAVVEGDEVRTPDGRRVPVVATRRTRAPAMRLGLSDGSVVTASEDHRFVRPSGEEVEARRLGPGDALATVRSAVAGQKTVFSLDSCIDEDECILQMPDPGTCLFCGRTFDGIRAAAAHQARFCEKARSKEEMAQALGIASKRLRRWMSDGRLPAGWARTLGLDGLSTGRVRLRLQNDAEHWFPESVPLDYGWGKLIGLFAAEGYRNSGTVSFALHAHEKHLQNHIARTVRQLGLRAHVRIDVNRCVVDVMSKMFSNMIAAFIGGSNAIEKFLRPIVFEAPLEFQRGVFDGLLEGDGHWSHDQQRETLGIASLDLASFALRFARTLGFDATMRRYENDHAGYWKVRFDPSRSAESLVVSSVDVVGETDLVDLAIDDPGQLYLLGNGVVSHNCRIGMGYHYRARCEFVLFFEKGKRKLADLGVPDVLAHPRVVGGYPTEKPVSLCEVLVRQSSSPGELVLDPFVGSGAVGVAAIRGGRSFLGNDLAEGAIERTRARLVEAGGVEES